MILVLSPEVDRTLKVSIVRQGTLVHESLSANETHTGWLVAIDETLQGAHVSLNDIHGIALIEKTSSFTGSRLMHTIGNTLAYACHIPVVGISEYMTSYTDIESAVQAAAVGVYVSPTYSGEPNIGPLAV